MLYPPGTYRKNTKEVSQMYICNTHTHTVTGSFSEEIAKISRYI